MRREMHRHRGTRSNADLLLDDERNTLGKEMVVWFKEPTVRGTLWHEPSGLLRIDNQGTIGDSKPNFSKLYANAHPSRRDPGADRGGP